jgi:cyclic-di-GMP-binding biofilm dispersal mediator protein
LGSAIAADLATRGADLTLVARDRQRLDQLEMPGHRVALDLRDPAACEAAIAAAVGRFGGLDVVVNAVGVVAFGAVEDVSVDAIEELFLTNTFVPMFLAKAALPALRSGGVIVNISGVVAERGLPGMAAYAASKAAVRVFDEALGREVRRRGIRVVDARPPHTETGLATRPVEGRAPKLPEGQDPVHVAAVICDAVVDGTGELTSEAFGPT